MVLMISSHSHRHIMQIREVKAHKDFPKNRQRGRITKNDKGRGSDPP